VSVTRPAGFVASGGAGGIKPEGKLDLALVATADGAAVPAAGVFTTNKAAAAPVQVSRRHLAASGQRAAAVLLTSGNANAATGPAGVAACEELCGEVARLLRPDQGIAAEAVLICQTGLIGFPFPLEVVRPRLPALVAGRGPGPEQAELAARAIMTTDTVPKEVVVEGEGWTVGGMAKGAAMLSPRMATMLAVLTTDAVVEPAVLQAALRQAIEPTFNRLSVDGATSTNDTVLVLASGASGRRPSADALAAALTDACGRLARQMAQDAEGGTKVAVVRVEGALDDEEAHRAARKVAESQLVQCSLNGADPYWGRVVSELGAAQVAFELDRVRVAYGGVEVCRAGVAVPHDTEAVAAHLAGREVEISCDLGLGTGRAAVLTTDLSEGYLAENRRTS
jgi:glutamate N-acetyltransferase/amino-acid N-acetyltransferase